MSRLRRLTEERGSVIVFTALILVGMLAVCALAVDFGSGFTKQRQLQGAADAAALAGAQDLPNTAAASSTAQSYASSNVSGLSSWSPSFPDSNTIDVTLSKNVPGTFSKFAGIDSVTVHAHSEAQVGTPGQVANALPIGVKTTVACTSASTGCFNTAKTLKFDDTSTTTFGSNSTFGLLDLSGSSTSSSACSGSVGQSQQAGWVNGGYPGLLSVNRYYGATTGQRIALQNALNSVIGTTLLIPVFDTANMSWCNQGGFHVVGWAAFVIDQTIPNSDWSPHVKILHGHFTQYIVHNVVSTPGITGYGVKVINLIQ
jgi:putative Flp pilus-assembly TadE/G-like protein